MKKIDWPIAIASLVISFLLWATVFSQQSKPQTPKFFELPVEVSPLPAGLIVTKIPKTISVSAYGGDEELRSASRRTPTAIVDLSRAQPGSKNYPVIVFPSELRSFLSDQRLTIVAEVERLKSKILPVKIETRGELNDASLAVLALNSDPKSVRISGPTSEIEAAKTVRGFLDLSEPSIASGQAGVVQLEILDGNGRILPYAKSEPYFANVRLTLGAAPEEKQVLISPSFRGTPQKGYIIDSFESTPSQITIRGSSLNLARLASIPTEQITLNGGPNPQETTVNLRLPDGVRVVGSSKIQIRIKFRPIDTQSPTEATNSVSNAPSEPE